MALCKDCNKVMGAVITDNAYKGAAALAVASIPGINVGGLPGQSGGSIASLPVKNIPGFDLPSH